jgi:predicted RNase H-like nuclease (RuvC/YqgF family)
MSNHIGDTNKMVGDTPRTDEAECESHIGISNFGHQDLYYAYKFARQLERELNAATSEIARLTSKVAQLYEGAEEQKQRIKRLEEAGDAMAKRTYDEISRDAWRKAKEAKL